MRCAGKYYPELFQRIKEAVKDGKWIAEGAMWGGTGHVIWLPGEALIRQLLYGKRYYQEEFGVDSKMLWLPDTLVIPLHCSDFEELRR